MIVHEKIIMSRRVAKGDEWWEQSCRVARLDNCLNPAIRCIHTLVMLVYTEMSCWENISRYWYCNFVTIVHNQLQHCHSSCPLHSPSLCYHSLPSLGAIAYTYCIHGSLFFFWTPLPYSSEKLATWARQSFSLKYESIFSQSNSWLRTSMVSRYEASEKE